MKTYIQKVNGILEIENGLERGYITGSTYNEYEKGAWIELGSEQISFYKENTTASAQEIIEMKLMPPLPEPTLNERKKTAVNQLTDEVVRAIEELYPLSLIRDVVLGRMSEKEIAQLREDYEKTNDAIKSALSDAKELIDKAADVEDMRRAVAGFANSVKIATVDSGVCDVIRDSLINTESSKGTELPVKEKNN